MFVLDTNILILYSRRDPHIVPIIEQWLSDNEMLVISTVTESELLSWPKLTNRDIRIIETILTTLVIVPVDSTIARVAATFRREHHVPLMDAFIAATAFLRNAPVVTRNINDFKKIPDIETIAP